MIKLIDLLKEGETVNPNQVFKDAGSGLVSALSNVKTLEEDVQTAAQILDAILATPAVLKYIGDEIKDVSEKLNIKKGVQFGSWLSKYTGTLSDSFKSPIKSVVKKFTNDTKKQDLITDGLYVVLVAGIAAYAGQGINDTIKQTKSDIETVKTLKAATDGDIQGLISQLT
jgi:hypothetical protein